MLAAFAAHALITPGFMPAEDRAWGLEICPEGFPAELLRHAHHHHHGGRHRGGEHCVFAAAPASGPLSHVAVPASAGFSGLVRALAPAPPATPVRLVHLPQARAPPAPV
jgi:hypothetical protein